MLKIHVVHTGHKRSVLYKKSADRMCDKVLFSNILEMFTFVLIRIERNEPRAKSLIFATLQSIN